MATLKMKAKPAAASSGPKLAKAGKASKPAAKGAKAAAEPTFKEGQEVIFKGYADTENENPIFAEGDRLLILKKDKDDDNKAMYDAIRVEDKEAYDADPDSVDGDQVHGSEIEKAPKEEVDPYAINVVAVGRLDEVLAEHGGDPLEAAQSLQEEAAENLFLFGGLAAQLWAGKKFQEYGEYEDEEVDGKRKHGTGWDRFCRDQFNMGGRDVNRLMRVYQNMSGLDLDWGSISRNKKIGYVKLEKIASVPNLTQETANDLLARAEEVNVEDFKAIIRDEYVSDGEARTASTGPKVKRTTFNFKLFEDQAEGVKYVIEQGKKVTGIDDENQLFELIAMQWAQQHLSETAFTKARAEKRKAQNALKKTGVDISKLKEADAALEEHLTVEEEDDGEAGAESETEA